MKNRFLRVLALCVLAALLCATALPAFAASPKPEMPSHTFWAGERRWCLGVYNAPEDARLVSVKSSNPKVLRVEKGDSLDNIFWEPLKPGKSKVTVTYKVGRKKQSISATYTVRKFPAPFDTLKVNGKSISPSSQKNIYDLENYKKTRATTTYKPKKGWEVVENGFEVFDEDRITLKSGKSVKIPKGKSGYAVIGLMNKKTGNHIVFFIHFYR